MTSRRSMIGLSIFLVVAFGLVSMTFVTLNRGVDGSSNSYTAVFTDATGLRVGDDVRMAGIRVGRVDAVELEGTQAKVEFQVQETQRLYRDTTAAITYQNVIGQRYLGLADGEAEGVEELPEDGEIGVERTEPSFDISVLLNGFEPLFAGLDPKQVDNLTVALVKALQGDQGSLTLLIEQMSTLAESVMGPDQILGDVITNLNQVVGTLANRSGEMSSLLSSTRSIIDGLGRHREVLLNSVTDVSAVAGRVATVVAEDRPALEEMLNRKPGFTQHFEQNKEKFAYLGFNVPALMKSLARPTQDGSYINVYLCNLNATLVPALSQVIPTIVRTATPSGAVEQSPICR